jgi:hypothetical protein
LQRKSKNILNSFESTKDVNGNIVAVEKQIEGEYKIEPAWFNIFGFVYLHFSLLQSYNIVHWNKTLAFGKISAREEKKIKRFQNAYSN